jgi:hypothetical protein
MFLFAITRNHLHRIINMLATYQDKTRQDKHDKNMMRVLSNIQLPM